jgi:group I intron endonuclease
MAEIQSTLAFGGEQSDLKSGIYAIRCARNGKLYVGSAVNLVVRWKAHQNALAAQRHHSIRLQRAWNKYGRDTFTFEVVELVEPERLIEREQFHIDAYRSASPSIGFNICPKAGSTRGAILSDEAKRKMSEAAKRARTPELRARVSAILKGRSLAPEHRANVVAASSQRFRTAEHIAKVVAARKGIPRSEETKRKVSEGLMGHPVSEETKARLRAAWVRRKARAAALKAAESSTPA